MLGGDSNGVTFQAWCYEEWRTKYAIKPPWGKKEMAQLHEARKRFDTEELARAAYTAYLASDDPFYLGHDPGKFISALSRFTVKAKPSVIKKPQSFPGAERAAEMVRILREVEADPSIPDPMKRDEAAKRWKEIP